MILTPAQNEIAADLHRFRVLCCGRRAGKTTLAVEEIKGKVISKPVRIAYIATTYQQSRDIAWSTLKNELQGVLLSVNESRLELTTKTLQGGKSDVLLRGWEAVETLRGQKFDFIVLDEVASMKNFWLNWQEVLRPTLTDTKGEAMFISSPKGFNHFYDLYNLESKDKDYKSFHYTSYDNPHLPKEEIDKAREELTEDRFAQEYLADFRKTEGLIYKEFSRSVHTFAELKDVPGKIERLVGIDWGYTNPTGITIFDRDKDENYWLVGEFYKPHKTTQEIIEYVKTLGANAYYADPAEPDRIEECRRAGMNMREVSKDIEAGINSVHSLLKNSKLKVWRNCVNFISEIETYSYREKLPGQNEREEPNKEHDHLMDSMRYVLHMQAARFSNTVARQFRPQNTQVYRRTSPRISKALQ